MITPINPPTIGMPVWRILLITEVYYAHHPCIRMLTAPPSVLGSHYLVVTLTSTGDDALELGDQSFDLAILDLGLGPSLALVERLRGQMPQLPILAFVDHTLLPRQRTDLQARGAAVADRPLDATQFRRGVSQLLANARP